MKRILIIALAFLSIVLAADAKRYYVTIDGNDSDLPMLTDADGNLYNPWIQNVNDADLNPGKSQYELTNIYEALHNAEPGDEIWVKGYDPNIRTTTGDNVYHVGASAIKTGFLLKPGVKMYGGFRGSETQLNERERSARFSPAFKYRTILSADLPENSDPYYDESSATHEDTPDIIDDKLLLFPGNTTRSGNADRVMTIDVSNATSFTTTLDGFFIMGGGNNDSATNEILGGGILVTGSGDTSGDFLIRNCLFFNNYAYKGSAIYVDASVNAVSGNYIIANCEVMNNCVGMLDNNVNDGSIYLAGNATLVNSVVYSNDGGAVVLSTQAKVINSTICRNTTAGIDIIDGIETGTAIPSVDGGCVLNSVVWGNFSTCSNISTIGIDVDIIPFFANCALQESPIDGFDFSENNNILLSSDNQGKEADIHYPSFSFPSNLMAFDRSFSWISEEYPSWAWNILYDSALKGIGNNAFYCINNYEQIFGTVDIEENNRIRYVELENHNHNIDIGAAEYQMVQIHRILYVKPDGTGDGSSWDNAMGDPQAAIEKLYETRRYDGELGEVWIAAGTYSPQSTYEGKHYTASFRMRDNINLYGGFEGNELLKSQREKGEKPWDFANETILQASNYDDKQFNWNDIDKRWIVTSESNHVLWFAPMDSNEEFANQTIVEGITIEGGNAMGLDGKDDFLTDRGAGVYMRTNSMLRYCKVQNCCAAGDGGGVYLHNASIEGCLIYNCSAKNNGGGIHLEMQGYITETAVMNCSAIDGAGIYLNKSDDTFNESFIILKTSVISNNVSKANGAVYVNGAGNILNCTITNNQTARTTDVADINATFTSGLYIKNKASIANTILWNNDLQNNTTNATQLFVLDPVDNAVNFYNIAIANKNAAIWNNTYVSDIYELENGNTASHSGHIHLASIHPEFATEGEENSIIMNTDARLEELSGVIFKGRVLADGTKLAANDGEYAWEKGIDYFWCPAQGSLLHGLGMFKSMLDPSQFPSLPEIDINGDIFADEPAIGAYVVTLLQPIPEYKVSDNGLVSLKIYIDNACIHKDHLGSSWDEPYHNLSEAINWYASLDEGQTITVADPDAKLSGDKYTIPSGSTNIHFEIHCKEGDYYDYLTPLTNDHKSATLEIPAMKIPGAHLHLYGGYYKKSQANASMSTDSEWARSPLETRTVLNGNPNPSSLTDGLYYVVYVQDNAKVHIDGFNIRGGYAFGAAIYKHGSGITARTGSELTLSNCIIENNVAANAAAIYSAGIVTLNNCLINNNTNLLANTPIIEVYSSTSTLSASNSPTNLKMNHVSIVNNIGTPPVNDAGGILYASSFAAGNITLAADASDADLVATQAEEFAKNTGSANVFTKCDNIILYTKNTEKPLEFDSYSSANFSNPTIKAGADINNITRLGGYSSFRPLTSSKATEVLINRASTTTTTLSSDITAINERNLGGAPDHGAYEAILPKSGLVYYVREPADGGSDSNSGLSWDKAFATIGKATSTILSLNNAGWYDAEISETSQERIDYLQQRLNTAKAAHSAAQDVFNSNPDVQAYLAAKAAYDAAAAEIARLQNELNNTGADQAAITEIENAIAEQEAELNKQSALMRQHETAYNKAYNDYAPTIAALNNAQAALEEANNTATYEKARPQIWVAAGTYSQEPSANGNTESHATGYTYDPYNCFSIVDGINVYGAFPPTGSPSMEERHPLVSTHIKNSISNDNVANYETILTPPTTSKVSYRVLGQSDYYNTRINSNNKFTAPTEWNGFTITGGYLNGDNLTNPPGNGGAGASIFTNVKLVNCIIAGNTTEGTPQELRGGGVFCAGGSIVNCYILNNKLHNTSTGGAQTAYGAGCYMYGGTSYNCVFSGNLGWGRHSDGAGIFLDSQGYFYNNTVVNNTSTGPNGTSANYTRGNGGICCWQSGQGALTIYNCISLGNSYNNGVTGNGDIATNGGHVQCYNTISGQAATISGRVTYYNNPIDANTTVDIADILADPHNTTTPDYRLKFTTDATTGNVTNLAINGGTEAIDGAVLPDDDMDYTDRIKDCIVDIGAYEYNITDIAPTLSKEDSVDIATYYISRYGWGDRSADSPDNAGCADKLQNVLIAAGEWVADAPQNTTRRARVKVAGYEEDVSFEYHATRLTNENYPRSNSFVVPDGVSLMGGYFQGTGSGGIYNDGSGFFEYDLKNEYGRNALKYKTVLSAYNKDRSVQGYHVVTFGDWFGTTVEASNGSDYKYKHMVGATIDGLHLQGGNADVKGNPTDLSLKGMSMGGAAIVPGNCVVKNCVIGSSTDEGKGNSAIMGGGLYLMPQALVYGTLIYGNSAELGGGIYADPIAKNIAETDKKKYFHAQVLSSTIVSNNASGYGGGIYSEGNAAMYTNCVVWDNDASVGKNVYGEGIASNNKPVFEQQYYDSQLSTIYENPDASRDDTEADEQGQKWSIDVTYSDGTTQKIYRYYPFNNCFIETYEPPSTIINTELNDVNDSDIFHCSNTVSSTFTDNSTTNPTTKIVDYKNSAAYYLPKLFSPIVRTGITVQHLNNFIEKLISTTPDKDVDMRGETRNDNRLSFQIRTTAGAFAFDQPTLPSNFIQRIFVAKNAAILDINLTDEQRKEMNGRSFYTPLTTIDDALQYIKKLRREHYHTVENVRFNILVAGGIYNPSTKREDATTANNQRQYSFHIPENVNITGGFKGDEKYYSPTFTVSADNTLTENTDDEINSIFIGNGFKKLVTGDNEVETYDIAMKDVLAKREFSDFNLNGLYEPWEFANQTVLSGNINSESNSGNAYHVVYSNGVERWKPEDFANGTTSAVDAAGNTYYIGDTKYTLTQNKDANGNVTGYTKNIITKIIESDKVIALDGITISDGQTLTYIGSLGSNDNEIGRGGGILTRRIPYVLNNCRIINNRAVHGGAIYATDASLNIIASNISNNLAMRSTDELSELVNHSGGAIYMSWRSWNDQTANPNNTVANPKRMQLRAINSLFANNEAQVTGNEPMADQSASLGVGGVVALRPTNASHTPVDIDFMNCNFVNNLADENPVIDVDLSPRISERAKNNIAEGAIGYNTSYITKDNNERDNLEWVTLTNCVFWGNIGRENVLNDHRPSISNRLHNAVITHSACDIDGFLRTPNGAVVDKNAIIDHLKNIRLSQMNMNVHGPRFSAPSEKAGTIADVYSMAWNPSAISILTDAGNGELTDDGNDDAEYKYKDWWKTLDESIRSIDVLYPKYVSDNTSPYYDAANVPSSGEFPDNPYPSLYILMPQTQTAGDDGNTITDVYNRFQGPLDEMTGKRVEHLPIDIGMFEYQYPTSFSTLPAVYIDIVSRVKKDGSSWDNASSDLRGAIIALTHDNLAGHDKTFTRHIYIRGYDKGSENVYYSPTLSAGGDAFSINMPENNIEFVYSDRLIIKGACTGNGHQQDFSKPTTIANNELKPGTNTLININTNDKEVYISGISLQNYEGQGIVLNGKTIESTTIEYNKNGIEQSNANSTATGKLTLANCSFLGNKHGGITVNSGDLLVYNTLFADNASGATGLVVNKPTTITPVINTTEPILNIDGSGYKIETTSATDEVPTVTLVNNTFANNTIDFSNVNGTTLNIFNTVSWNSPERVAAENVTQNLTGYIAANQDNNNVSFAPGTVNSSVTAGPNFVDPYNGDYRLRPSTQLVDLGSKKHYISGVVKPEMFLFQTKVNKSDGTEFDYSNDDFDTVFADYLKAENENGYSDKDVADFINYGSESGDFKDDTQKNRTAYAYDLESMRRVTNENIDIGAFEYDTENRRIIYVKSGLLSSDRTGSSWENAALDLQGAVDLAGIHALTLNGKNNDGTFDVGEHYCYVFVDKNVRVDSLNITLPYVKVYGSMDGETTSLSNEEDDTTVLPIVEELLSKRKGLLEMNQMSTIAKHLYINGQEDDTQDKRYIELLKTNPSPGLDKYSGYPLIDGFYIGGIHTSAEGDVDEDAPLAILNNGVVSNSIIEFVRENGMPWSGVRVKGGSKGWLYNCLVRGKITGLSSTDYMNVANVTATNEILANTSIYSGNNIQDASFMQGGIGAGTYFDRHTKRYWRYQLNENDNANINSGTNSITAQYAKIHSDLSEQDIKDNKVLYLIGHRYDLAGNTRLRTSAISPDNSTVDNGCFETWYVTNNYTINGNDYPHGSSVVYVNEDVELSLGTVDGSENGTPLYSTAATAFNPGFLLLRDNAGLRGNGNYVNLSYFAVERKLAAGEKSMFVMPFDIGSTIGLEHVNIFGYDGAERAKHNYKYNDMGDDSDSWTSQIASTSDNTTGLLFEENKGEDITLRFYSRPGQTDSYTEVPGQTKPITLVQFLNKTDWDADNSLDNASKFTHKENMGWNLFGSPYLCALDYKDMEYMRVMYSWNWNKNTNIGSYSTIGYDASSGSYAGEGHIPMLDAVFTQTATLKSTEVIRVAQPTSSQKSGEAYQTPGIAAVTLSRTESSDSKSDTDVFSINAVDADDAHSGFDMSTDGVKWMTTGIPQIYATNNGGRYSLLSAVDRSGRVPIGISLPEPGIYSFSVPEECQDLDYDAISLIDTLEGTETDLLSEDYTIIAAEAGDIEGRFSIVFREPKLADADLHAWSEKPHTLSVSGLAEGDIVSIYSAAGIMFIRTEALSSTETFEVNTSGVVLIKVENEQRCEILKTALAR